MRVNKGSLSNEQKTWMYKAVLRILLADKNIDASEMLTTREALAFLGMEINLNTIMNLINNGEKHLQIYQVELPYDAAFTIASECISAGAIDTKLSPSEIKEIQNILKLLQFSASGIDKLIEWGLQLSKSYNQGVVLKQHLAKHHKSKMV